MDTVDLIRRIAANKDRDAYGDLYRTFLPVVRAMLIRQGASVESAEEIAQEAMLTVWRKAGLYAPDRGSVATWVFTIARNLRIDRLRREVPWQQLDDERPEERSEGPLPDEEVASGQIQRKMRSVVSTLPEDQAVVVRLSYIDGLSHSEIAEKLDLPLGTVKSRMRLAYQKIRDAFEHDYDH